MICLLSLEEGEDKSSPFKNRLRKNYRHFRKWARRNQTDCFRIYDKEIRGYPLAVDYYGGYFVISYFAPSRQESEPKLSLVSEVESTLADLFKVDPCYLFWRNRLKRTKSQQYEKSAQEAKEKIVYEYGTKFRVNLTDYLDTGLFLDHRLTRKLVAEKSEGKRLLNLFAYTGAFSVHAACHGAKSTCSIDLSNTYCQWARSNFDLNGLKKSQHEIVREDAFKALVRLKKERQKFDLIVLDPPTISRSKRMEKMLDVQIDAPFLILQALELLDKNGSLFFSTNLRTFKFSEDFLTGKIRDISHKTIPEDFHDKKIHRCFQIEI